VRQVLIGKSPAYSASLGMGDLVDGDDDGANESDSKEAQEMSLNIF
jgi:hypothetical protein